MKKLILFFFLFIILCCLILFALDILGIWSIRETVVSYVREHPRIEPYLKTEADLQVLAAEITSLESANRDLNEEVAELERRLRAMADIVDRKDTQIQNLEERIVNIQLDIDDREARIMQMARIYSQMKPAEAAVILADLDDEIIIELLFIWEDRFAAQVMANLDPHRSARISEAITE